jgi:hypothetical protein
MASNLNNNDDISQINYINLSGPYYRIFVNGIALDKYPWLSKQIKSVEITEISSTATSEAGAVGTEPLDMATITIVDLYENVTGTTNNLVNTGIVSGKPGNILDLVIDVTSSSSNIRVLSTSDLKKRKTIITSSAPQNTTTPKFVYTTATQATLQGANIALTINSTLDSNIVGQNIYKGSLFNESTLGSFQAGTIIAYDRDLNQLLVSGLTGIPTGPATISEPLTIYAVQTLQTPTLNKSSKLPKFLFQEDNVVDIEWGYTSDPSKSRNMRFIIKYVEYDAADSSNPEAKIYCIPAAIADLKKNYPTIGQAFYDIYVNPLNNESTRFTAPITAGQLVKRLADKLGYDSIISNTANKLNTDDRVDIDFVTRWTPDMSILNFISLLAFKTHHHFEVGWSPIRNKNVISFVSDEDYSKKPCFNIIWKGTNGILQSYNLKADFSRLPDGAATSIDPDAPSNGIQINYRVDSGLTIALKQPEDTSKGRIATPNITPDSNIDSISTGIPSTATSTVGSSKYSPSNQPNGVKIALDAPIRMNQFPTIINGVMLGYPLLSTGIVNISNIGLRYSGRYRLTSIKHIIDIQGYKLEFSGITNVVSDSLQDTTMPPGDTNPVPTGQQVQIRQPSLIDQTQTAFGINLGMPPLDTTGDASNYSTTPQLPGKVKNLGGIGAIVESIYQNAPNNGTGQR